MGWLPPALKQAVLAPIAPEVTQSAAKCCIKAVLPTLLHQSQAQTTTAKGDIGADGAGPIKRGRPEGSPLMYCTGMGCLNGCCPAAQRRRHKSGKYRRWRRLGNGPIIKFVRAVGNGENAAGGKNRARRAHQRAVILSSSSAGNRHCRFRQLDQ